ncbi:MAG: NAD-dependent epimerase/dehydratase family protein [Acidimicrobiales bacterium]
MTIAVIGANGWLGGRILAEAAAAGEAVGLARREQAGLVAVGSAPGALRAALVEISPRSIINAAGLTHGSYAALHAANVAIVREALDAAGRLGARLVHLGAAAEYGDPGTDAPVSETHPVWPLEDYGRTKLAAAKLVLAARRRGGVDAGVARVFAVVGPGPAGAGALGALAREVVRLHGHGYEHRVIAVRHGHAVRDFVPLDVVARSAVALALAPRLRTPIVNVCTGRGRSYLEVVAEMLRQTGGGRVEAVPGGGAIPCVVGDPSVLRQHYGIAAAPSLEDLARIAVAAASGLEQAPASG